MAKQTVTKDSGARAAYIRTLAFEWLKINRSDVIEAARIEGLKRYPPKNGIARTVPVLPQSLKDLK